MMQDPSNYSLELCNNSLGNITRCGSTVYTGIAIGIKLLPGFSVRCGCVPAFQDTFTVACGTLMALLSILVSKLVSFAFSTIPICPFLIPQIFHLLVQL